MKNCLLLLAMCGISTMGFSQSECLQKRFFRFYEENDAFNVIGQPTDFGYTNGGRLDFFYQPKKKAADFFSRLNLSAGKNSNVTSGWGLMQVMITPKRIWPSMPDKNDYSYCGSLLAIHTVHSANEEKKLNVETEWVLGMMGPPSLAKETQITLHTLTGDIRPNGWDYQLPTDLLINYNLAAEKQINTDRSFQLTGGGQVFLGSLSDGLSIFTAFRFQKNLNSFSGMLNQYFTTDKTKPGIMLSVRPAADLIFYNALLDGGLFNKKSPVHDKGSEYGTTLQRKKLTGRLDLLLLISFRNVAISFTQKATSTEFKNYSSHNVGNISIYFGW